MVVLILFEVFMRYVVGRPPIIADEISAYMLVAISFLGMAYAWKEKAHVRVDIIVSRLPPRVAIWLRLIALVLAFIFVVGLSQASCDYVGYSFKTGMYSNTVLHVSLRWPQMTLVIGYILLSFLLITEIARTIVNIRSGASIERKAK